MAAGVLRGRPIAVRENARRAEADVQDQLMCNRQPRYSLAGYLTAAQLRRAQSMPGVPGRVPAPRQEISCVDAPDPAKVQGRLWPGFVHGSDPLPPDTPGGPPGRPPVGPGPGPGPSPYPPPGPPGGPPVGPGPGPGPGPFPPSAPPPGGPGVPPGGPPSGGPPPGGSPPGGPPSGGPPSGPCPCPGPSPYPPGGAPMNGFPRTLNFHLSGSIAGGSALSEVRVSPRLDRFAVIRSVEVIPVAGTSVGQFVDILVSTDDDTTDVAVPTGGSIFEPLQGQSGLPVEDRDVGLPVTDHAYDVPMAFWLRERGAVLKVVGRFAAPAVAPPQCHVVVVLEEFDTVDVPIVPRPPIGPGPPAVPPPGPVPDVPVAPAPPVPPYAPPPVPVTPVPPWVPAPSPSPYYRGFPCCPYNLSVPEVLNYAQGSLVRAAARLGS